MRNWKWTEFVVPAGRRTARLRSARGAAFLHDQQDDGRVLPATRKFVKARAAIDSNQRASCRFAATNGGARTNLLIAHRAALS
jgi:hypothetical protein